MGCSSSSSDLRVVIIGGGYAGTAAAKQLDGKCKVTLIESGDALHHKIAAIRGSIVPGWEKRTRVPLNKLLKHGKVVQNEVASVETGRVTLKDGSIIECDYIILAHGQASNFPYGLSDDAKDSASVMDKLRDKQRAIAAAQSILIVGGGPVGVEFAGEILAQHPGKKVTLVHGGDKLLNNTAVPLIEKAVMLVESKLLKLGAVVKLKTRVNNLPAVSGRDAFLHQSMRYELNDGSSVDADLAIVCIGLTARSTNLVNIVDDHNLVRVQPDLQVEGLPRVYCIGDANNVRETKMAYFAAKQAGIACKNIVNTVAGKPTVPYVPTDGKTDYGVMLIPMGPKIGVTAMGKSVMGDGMSSLFKGKGLFSKKTFADMNLPLPAL